MKNEIPYCPEWKWWPKPFQQVKWVVEARKQIDKDVIKKYFDTCGVATSDKDKAHCLGEGQPTEEARVLLGESNSSIQFVPRPTLYENMQEETSIYIVQNVEGVTDKILEEDEV